MNKWPYFSDDEKKSVLETLESGKVNYWTGEKCKIFEEKFSKFIGVKYGISVSNGTVSLELALRACSIGKGDEVITTPRTFFASISAIVAVGATPILVDVDPDNGNIKPANIAEKITKKTKAIIPVHLAGYPCEMDTIMDIAFKNRVYVIEDCAQAHGAEYKGKRVGSWGHFGSFSFCQDKIMTTGGEGGMLVTNNTILYKKAWSYKDHGKNYDSVFKKNHTTGYRWIHDSFGSNMRMTEMQAAIGIRQLYKLPNWLLRRNEIASCYNESFKPIKAVEIPKLNNNIFHAFYKYYLLLNYQNIKNNWNRNKIIAKLAEKNIPCFSGSCSELYLEKSFANSDFSIKNPLYEAKKIGERSLMLQCHPTLSEKDVDYIIKHVSEVLKEASLN